MKKHRMIHIRIHSRNKIQPHRSYNLHSQTVSSENKTLDTNIRSSNNEIQSTTIDQ